MNIFKVKFKFLKSGLLDSSLRQFLATECALNMTKNAFYFILKSSFRYQDFILFILLIIYLGFIIVHMVLHPKIKK